MIDNLSNAERWFILRSGEDTKGCGLSPDKACRTLTRILQAQVLSKNPDDVTLGSLQIITDMSINIDQAILVRLHWAIRFIIASHYNSLFTNRQNWQ